jgi:hypothetical protein
MPLTKRQLDAMKHPDVLGAGAQKRRKLRPSERGAVIWAEFEKGTLHAGGGAIVKNPAQARAIIYSEVSKKKRS